MENKANELGEILQQDKKSYETHLEKYRHEKKKLTKLCKVLEEDLLKKDQELRLVQQKLTELYETMHISFGTMTPFLPQSPQPPALPSSM